MNGQTLAASGILDKSWTERFYLSGSSVIKFQIENGRKSEYARDYRDRVVESKSFPYAGKELITKTVYEHNQVFYTEDPYGRRNYSAYSAWDPTKKIRQIQCLYPGIAFADLQAVIDADRANHPKCLISDAIRDDQGNMTEAVDPRGTSNISVFDTRNQLIESLAAAGTAVERKTETVYDANGNVIESRSPRYFDSSDTDGYQKSRSTTTFNGRNLVRSRSVAPGTSVAATTFQSYHLDGRDHVHTDANGKDWKSYYHSCCGRFLGHEDPLGHGSISNTDYEGRVTHTATVETYASHVNSHNPVDALTHGETTTRFDGLGRTRASTTWLVEQGLVNPNNVPIAGLDGISTNDGLTSQVFYDNNLVDGVGLDGTGVTIPILGGSGSYSLDVSAVLSKLLAVTGISFTANESSASAVVSIDGEEEISVAISDALGRVVISARLQPHDGASPFSLTTWNCGKHDMIATMGTDDVLENWSIDGAGNTSKSRTDGGGRTLQSIIVVSGTDQITEMTYDPSGNLLTSTDPNGVGQASAVYDELGQQLGQTDSYGIQTSSAYDFNGNVVSSTDAKGKTSYVKYDAQDRTASTTDRFNRATCYTYSVTGDMLTVKDAEGRTTTFEYSDRGAKTRELHPDHAGGTSPGDFDYGIEELLYDPAGRLVRKTDQNGDTITFNYDLANRMTSKDYRLSGNSPSGTIADSDIFSHDATGRILAAESQRYNNIVTRSYDDGGRLASESTAIDGQNYTVAYGYNSANQQSSITYPDGTLVTRSFNDRGQLAQVQYDGSVIDTRVYDAGGRLDTSTYANGVITDYDYRDDTNGKDNLTSQIATTNSGTQKVGTYSYSYDANRNKSTETISGAGFMSGYSLSSSTYDDDDRLTAWHRADLARDQFWTLSPVGNWNTHKVEAPTRTFAHSDAHEIDSIDGVSITNDSRGNVKQVPASISASGDPLEFTLDMDNRMSGMDTDGDGNLNKQARYDAFGRRVKFGGMGSPATFIYSGQQVICRYGNGANPSSPKLKWVYGSYIDEPVMLDRKVNSVWSRYYYSRNSQYSITAQTDDSGNVVERYAYDSHGQTRIMTASGTKRNSPAFNNNFCYTGRYYHAEPEVYCFRARLYSPSLGRFLSRDPLGFVDGMSLYGGYFAMNGMDPGGSLVIRQDGPSTSTSFATADVPLRLRVNPGDANPSIEGEFGFKLPLSITLTTTAKNPGKYFAIDGAQLWQRTEIIQAVMLLNTRTGEVFPEKDDNRYIQIDVVNIPSKKFPFRFRGPTKKTADGDTQSRRANPEWAARGLVPIFAMQIRKIQTGLRPRGQRQQGVMTNTFDGVPKLPEAHSKRINRGGKIDRIISQMTTDPGESATLTYLFVDKPKCMGIRDRIKRGEIATLVNETAKSFRLPFTDINDFPEQFEFLSYINSLHFSKGDTNRPPFQNISRYEWVYPREFRGLGYSDSSVK